MIEIDDLAHHMKQEEQERALASVATTPSLRDAHLAMAKRHARRVAQAIIEEAGSNIS